MMDAFFLFEQEPAQTRCRSYNSYAKKLLVGKWMDEFMDGWNGQSFTDASHKVIPMQEKSVSE